MSTLIAGRSGRTVIPNTAPVPAALRTFAPEGASVLAVGVLPMPWVRAVLDQRSASGFEPPLVIIETDAARARAWTGAHGSVVGAALGAGRLRVFAGPGAIDAYASWRVHELGAAPPTIVLDDAVGTARRAVEGARQRLARRCAGLRARQALLARDVVGVGRPAAHRPRVLAFTTRFSTVVHEALAGLCRAMRRADWDVELITEDAPHAGDVDTLTPLAERPFDLVVTMNRLRADLGARLDPRIPLVSWLQDHRLEHRRADSGRDVGPRDVVLAHSPAFLAAHCGFPRAAVLETTNVTEPMPNIDDAPPEPALACDVVYAGHGAQTPEDMVTRSGAAPRVRACLQHLAHACRRELHRGTDLSGLVVAALLLESERAAGLGPLAPRQRAVELQPLAMQLVDRILRHETLRWTATWASERGRRFLVVGRDWERVPAFAPHAVGAVEPGAPLRRLLRAARVVIQVNGYASMHPRLLDALAAGTPVLTRYNPADWLRRPQRRLRTAIAAHGIESFDDLDALAAQDATVARAMDELRRLGVPLLAPGNPDRRRRELAFLQAVGAQPVGHDAAGDWFVAIRDGTFIARRAAGDLPGFRATTFRDPAGLSERLDALMAAPGRPEWLAPMRGAVLRHDTYDALVPRLWRRLRLRADRP